MARAVRAARILLLGLIVSAVALAAARPARAASIVEGKITEVSGAVEVRKRGGEDWIAAYPGMKITPGDQITTGIGGRAVLELKDSKTEILALTQFVVGRCVEDEKTNYSELFLQIGKVASEVSKQSAKANKFNIVTPTTVAGVRGTRMTVSHLPALGTQVQILEGRGYTIPLPPPAPMPALTVPAAREEKKAKEEKEKKEKEDKREAREDRKEERKAEREERRAERAEARAAPAEPLTIEQIMTASAASPEAAVEVFNQFLESFDQSISPDLKTEDLGVLDVKTFETVIEVDVGQRVEMTSATATDFSAIVTPTRALELDALTSLAPAGLSATEIQATTTTVESTVAPEAVQIRQELSTSNQVTESATATSTSQGGLPPSTELVPPSLPDRTNKSNLTN